MCVSLSFRSSSSSSSSSSLHHFPPAASPVPRRSDRPLSRPGTTFRHDHARSEKERPKERGVGRFTAHAYMASEASPLLPRGTTTRGNRNRQRRGGSGRGGEEGRRRAMDRRQMPASGAAAESSAAGGRGGLGGGAVGASRSFTLAASQSRSQPDPPQHPYPQHSPPSSGPLLGQPVDEGILAVRAAALTVYSPLTYTWVSSFLSPWVGTGR